MEIKGKPIANAILEQLKSEILNSQIQPHLAIVLTDFDPNSQTYVKYKVKAAEVAGIQVTVHTFTAPQYQAALQLIEQLNQDPTVHGIIVQVPVYPEWDIDQLVEAIDLTKDVDGFLANTPFIPATAHAVWKMLEAFADNQNQPLTEFLETKRIVVLGHGRTAGKPIVELLRRNKVNPSVVDIDTPNPDQIIQQADIVISAVGKPHLINASNLKSGAFVIGVGVSKQEIGSTVSTVGDVDEEQIKDLATLYCPTIGGIGPLTIAYLLTNVVQAAKSQ